MKLQHVKALGSKHNIEVPQIAKAALAIMNTRTIDTDVAFGQYQAARTWAFLPGWQAEMMPDATDIDGPTVQSATVKVNVNKDETVIQVLTNLRDEQAGLNTHSHAPYDELMRTLNGGGKKMRMPGRRFFDPYI